MMDLISIMKPEIWVDIRGFEGFYQISNYGRVRGLDREIIDSVGHVYTIPGKILIPRPIGKGYYAVHLNKNNIRYPMYIHQMVAYHFCIWYPINKREYVSNHIDGDKLNNYYENLEWCTYSENNYHAYRTNLKPRGEDFYNSKLTETQVREIKENGKYSTYQNIAENYGVSKATVRDVLKGNTWKYT